MTLQDGNNNAEVRLQRRKCVFVGMQLYIIHILNLEMVLETSDWNGDTCTAHYRNFSHKTGQQESPTPLRARKPVQLLSLQINRHDVEDSPERVDLGETVPQINGLNVYALTFSLKRRLKNHSCRVGGRERTSSRSAWPFPV